MTISTGTKLGHYEIRSKIGEGGMGEVYQAEDTRLHRNVALKVLPADLAANRDRMRRFEQEAQSAAALSHPNIAQIFEIGEDGGTHFIAMEFVDGQTLRQLIRAGKTDLAKLLRYLQHAAEGLAKAHAAGIIHRDLKPDNIMVTRDGHAKILDFGLSKLVEGQGDAGTRRDGDEVTTVALSPRHPISPSVTSPGLVMGTVGYMSPEQAQGKTGEIDQRSDVFSFGCILFEVVTGRRAFEGKDPIDSLNKIIREPAPPISEFRPDLPSQLQRIIRRCLAKDPEDRYQTIKDLAIELRDLRHELASTAAADLTATPSGLGDAARSVASGATQSMSPSSTSSIGAGIWRHKLVTAIVITVLALGAMGVGMFLHARNTEVAIESIAVLPFQNKSTEGDTEYLSDGLTESLIYRLSQLPNLKVSPTSSVLRYKGKDIDPIKVGRELDVSAVLSGRITQRGENLTISAELVDVRTNKLLWGDHYDRKTAELLATQREIAHEIVDNLRIKVSPAEKSLAKHYTESNEAYQLYLKGRFYWNKRTREALKKAIDYFNQAIERDPGFALAYAGLADCYVVPANELPPSESMPKAKAAAMRALELDDSLAEAHTSLGRVLAVYDWDWAEAEREFKRAIELNPRYAIAHQWYGGYFESMHRFNEAIAEEKRALELDPLSPILTFSLGLGFYYARDYDKAIEYYQKTLELDPNFPPAYGQLPAAYEQKGMYDQALAGFQKGFGLESGGEWYFAGGGLGHVYAVTRKTNEARAVLDELKRRSDQEYERKDRIALIYVGLGEKDQALAWLEKAYQDRAFNLAWLNVEPRWDSLRSDLRFKDLVRRVGLPQ